MEITNSKHGYNWAKKPLDVLLIATLVVISFVPSAFAQMTLTQKMIVSTVMETNKEWKYWENYNFQPAEYLYSYPPPTPASPTAECLRADYSVSSTKIPLEDRPEFVGKAACSAETAGEYVKWPIKIKYPGKLIWNKLAAEECYKAGFRNSPFQIKKTFPGEIIIKYCFAEPATTTASANVNVDAPNVSNLMGGNLGNISASVETQYHVNCAEDFIQRRYEHEVEVDITCVPRAYAPDIDYKEYTSVSKRIKSSCPKGFWVEGTNKQVYLQKVNLQYPIENKTRRCVPEGTPFVQGSQACPFIFTQTTPDGQWIEQGTILTYHNGKETERTQVRELSVFSGKILIKEIDPETSYTDSLRVILYYEDGEKEVLLPDISELRKTDGDYLITNQGDEILVDFGSVSDKNFKRAEIITNGYYELY